MNAAPRNTKPSHYAWLLRLCALLPGKPKEPASRNTQVLLIIFLLLATVIVTLGYFIYKHNEQHQHDVVTRQLASIAALKTSDLTQFRQERLADGNLLLDNPAFTDLVRHHLTHPEDKANDQQLQHWLTKLQAHYQYDQIRLLDIHGVTRLSQPTGLKPASAAVAQSLPEVLNSGQPAIQDFYRHDYDGRIYLAVLVPILDRQNSNQPLGLVSLRIDPAKQLYPFIQRWPVPSSTAETMLVRRDGQQVTFLNELRFKKDTALILHFPVSQPDLPAAQAVRGQIGITAGRDYRDLPVLADLRPIPDSPWFLVSKISASEAYAPLLEHLWLMSGFILILLCGVGSFMVLIGQGQRMALLKERFEKATALKKLNRVYAMLSNINQAIVRIRDPRELFQTACRIAVEDGGFVMTWIGLLDQISGAVIPQAKAGKDEGYVDRLCITLDDPSRNQGPTGEALREGRHSICNDIAGDERMTPWRDVALAQGYRSSAAFPLIVSGIVRGTINLYAPEPDCFTTEEIKLLDELASDISFALEFAEQEQRRQQSEAALRESEQLFASVANSSPALIWLAGTDMGRTWFNDPWLAFTGRTMEEELGNGCLNSIHPYDLPGLIQTYTEAFAARRPFAIEYRLLRHDGVYRWFINHGLPRYDASGAFAGFIGSCMDINDHRELEKQIRHAVKMESIGTLAGGVAHDFNNILMIIIGYGQLSLMTMSPDDPQRANIEHILAGADRATHLTKELLLFSRKQISERKPLDLSGVVTTVEKFIIRVIGEDITCRTSLPDQPLIVLADSHQLEQVLMNFATNARDAMPNGGIFSITVEQTTLAPDFIKAHGFGQPGTYALLTISDSGSGMDEKTQARIFEPFFTTKEMGKGTGLGLAVAYGIIKQHEGYINVYSEPGNGTTFRVYLPLTGEKILATKSLPAETAARQGTETILIAEDDAVLRTFAREILTQFGYTVIEAGDGEEAVQKFKENQEGIQLLLLDLLMPKMNGQQAYEAINRIKPGIRTIFMSGYAPEMIREKVGMESTMTLLAKPLTSAELLRKIRETFDQQADSAVN